MTQTKQDKHSKLSDTISPMIMNNDRTVVQISKFVLPAILQHFLPKFFSQFHCVFAKIFVDENTGIFQKFRVF